MNRLILPLAFGLLGGAVLASSCGPTRTCNATTCTGCCDTTGECRSGFDNSACGTRASMCTTCGLGQTCLSGACSTTGSGAGTATGGGFSGTGGGSTGGGSTAGGGTGGGATACNSTNCPGCCASGGQCFTGRSDGACGSAGSSCVACSLGQTCTALAVGGRCLSSGPGGGSAGGGSTGGGTSGGGSATGGGTGGGSTGCSPQSCTNGCCFNGQCQAPTAARCGRNGAVCTTCQSTNTCVNGACTPCAGCVDIGSGTCVTGTTNAQCGRQGQFCADCAIQSLTCQSGSCLPAPPPCTAQNCSTGCCDPMSGACIPRTSQTATQCGQGSAGALCIACSSGTCDTASGSCSTGGFDGGLPPFPDGGLGSFCVPGFPLSSCAPGDCCFPFMGFGVCATIGNPNLLGGTTCGVSGMDCNPAPCVANQTCNASGVCQ